MEQVLAIIAQSKDYQLQAMFDNFETLQVNATDNSTVAICKILVRAVADQAKLSKVTLI